MEKYCEPVLSEEQMAAYLDGMLSPEESYMVEELINSNPEMVEIQDVIDSVDSTYIYETDQEIPIECMADDFSLPDIRYDYSHSEDNNTDEYISEQYDDDESGDYNDEYEDTDFQDGSFSAESEYSFIDNDFGDLPI